MRILLLYETAYPAAIGGIELRNHALAMELARRGHAVTLATFGDAPPDLPAGVEHRSLGPAARLYRGGSRRSSRQALRFAAATARLDLAPYDAIETANMPYLHLPGLALRCRRSHRPLVVTWYEYWGPYWRSYLPPALAPFARAFERATLHLGARLTCQSALVARRLERGRRRDEIDVVPCGVDLRAIEQAARTPLPCPPLVVAGRLLAHKRIDLLLRALARLAAAPAGPLLAIVGSGPELPRLAALAGELGIADRVSFRPPLPDSLTLWRTMAGACIAVQPSAREGFGLFPLEAMALGLPVVYCASPESAVGELVRDGVEGVCVAPSPAELAASLAALLADPESRHRFGEAGRRRAAGYDWSHAAGALESCLAALSARR